MAPLRVVGIDFDHMHMGDLLREVHVHADAEIAGVCDADPKRMQSAIANFSIPADKVFTDVEACLKAAMPDVVVLCAAPANHARYVEQIAPFGPHIVVEKPFATSTTDARRMIAAMKPGQKLAINWPLAWYRSHNTAKRLLDQDKIGELIKVHYYDGNRGRSITSPTSWW